MIGWFANCMNVQDFLLKWAVRVSSDKQTGQKWLFQYILLYSKDMCDHPVYSIYYTGKYSLVNSVAAVVKEMW